MKYRNVKIEVRNNFLFWLSDLSNNLIFKLKYFRGRYDQLVLMEDPRKHIQNEIRKH